MKRLIAIYASMLASSYLLFSQSAFAEADPEKGKQAYRQCVVCHSLEQGANRTGPSLYGIWNRKAGAVSDFQRYSKALKESNVIWNGRTMDQWLANPKDMVPGNRMVFRGIDDPAVRADLIAFLKSASNPSGRSDGTTDLLKDVPKQGPANLRALGSGNQITSIRYCGDTFEITTATGEIHQFWEFNVRLKTDSSKVGPMPSKPVLIPAGMRGDRVSVIFSDPMEISATIQKTC